MMNTFGKNPYFIKDIEDARKEGTLTDVKYIKNYHEIRSLIINLVLYIFANPEDEKCKIYTREEFCPSFIVYIDEINEADKSKAISFLRDSNQAFEDVCITRSTPDRTLFESRYNRFRQYALATILGPKYLNPAPKSNLMTKEKKLSMSQIALKLVYEGAYLSREKANEIIIEYGHNSGPALYNKFIQYSQRAFRIDGNVSIKILKNKIKLIDSVIEILPEDMRSLAIDEVKNLRGSLVSLE